jgi:hypothetical protein
VISDWGGVMTSPIIPIIETVTAWLETRSFQPE